jgi:hypothetical protein
MRIKTNTRQTILNSFCSAHKRVQNGSRCDRLNTRLQRHGCVRSTGHEFAEVGRSHGPTAASSGGFKAQSSPGSCRHTASQVYASLSCVLLVYNRLKSTLHRLYFEQNLRCFFFCEVVYGYRCQSTQVLLLPVNSRKISGWGWEYWPNETAQTHGRESFDCATHACSAAMLQQPNSIIDAVR